MFAQLYVDRAEKAFKAAGSEWCSAIIDSAWAVKFDQEDSFLETYSEVLERGRVQEPGGGSYERSDFCSSVCEL